MERDILIKKAVENISKLQNQQLQEVADFAEFLLNKSNTELLVEDIQQIVNESNTFDFLGKESEIYSVEDIKKNYK